MVGKVTARSQGPLRKGRKQVTTTFKKGGTTKKASGGKVKRKLMGGGQGYNARLDESLGARHPGASGSLAGRRAMSKGMEKSMGRGAYSGASTMAKRGGKIKK
jgi:hypothetical protein